MAIKPSSKKEIEFMVTKAASPFDVVPQNKPKINENKQYDDSTPKNMSIPSNEMENKPSDIKDDRESIDVWRASQMSNGLVENNSENVKENFATKQTLDQWYLQGPRENGTITEDVEAENAEGSSRMTNSSIYSRSSHRDSVGPMQNQADFEPRNNEEENELHQIHMLQSLQALQYMKNVPLPPIDRLYDRMIKLPPFKHSGITKTLIFDMDETLIHCVDDIDEENPQKVLTVRFEDGEEVEAGINVRPYAIDCLKAANEIFQVIVFTASHKCYADVVLDHLDPTGELIQYRLYRDSCYKTSDNVYIKDLRIIQNRYMEDLVIVDNAVYSFGFQLDNGIPIIPYYDDPEDEELYHLIPYLDILAESDDVREKNREAFQLREMAKQNTQDLEYFDNRQ